MTPLSDTTRSAVDTRSDSASPARVQDYLLGGKDNAASDREAAQRILDEFPETLDAIRAARCFLSRAVRWLSRAGVAQFIDLGCGMPTTPTVHHIAQRIQPHARVVYVDHDPVVLAHARALLATDQRTSVVAGDITYPDGVLTEAHYRGLVDLSAPAAMLCVSVGHLLTLEELRRMLGGIAAAAAPASYIAFAQLSATTPAGEAEFATLGEDIGIPLAAHTPEHIGLTLTDFDPVRPGLGEVSRWRRSSGPTRWPHIHSELRQYVGASRHGRLFSYGGVLHHTRHRAGR